MSKGIQNPGKQGIFYNWAKMIICKIHASAAAGTGGATLGDICKMEEIAARGQEMPPHARQIYQLASAEKWGCWPGVWCMVQRIINIYMLYPAPPSAQPLTVGIIITQAGVACTHQHILHSIEIPCQALNSKPKSYSNSRFVFSLD